MPAYKAIKAGKILPGDIVLHSGQHTNVFAGGDDIWYDSGHFNCTPMTGENVPFTHRWRCHKGNDASPIAYVIRYKGPTKTYYRINFKNCLTQKGADKVVKQCYDKTKRGAFYEQMSDKKYHCYTGSYEDLNTANKELAIVQQWYPKAKIEEKIVKG
jgi:hypothetical protein